MPRLECGRADARGAQRGREVALARFALLPSDGGQDCPGQAHGLRRCVCATTRVHSPTTVAPPCALLRVRLIGCIGGLEESVTEDIVRAAFVPFGEIIDVNLPLDSTTRAFCVPSSLLLPALVKHTCGPTQAATSCDFLPLPAPVPTSSIILILMLSPLQRSTAALHSSNSMTREMLRMPSTT